ncbi:MAG: hypothetical protein AAGF12_34495 [Myxococcota bacterium]
MFRVLVLRLAVLAVVLVSACSDSRRRSSDDSSVGGSDDGSVDGSLADRTIGPDGQIEDATADRTPIPTPAVTALDLLLVIDNSGSMEEEQRSLVREIPALIRALTTGDINGNGADDPGDFAPGFSDLNVGVVTTDMGSGGFPNMTCGEPNAGDDGVLRTDGASSPGCMPSYPRVLNFQPALQPGGDAQFASDVSCVALPGLNGCGFEQQLEAMLKAVTRSDSGIRFAGGAGHADGANAGFLRGPDESALAIIVLSDEADCSAMDPELFNLDTAIYVGNPNLRCFQYPDALHPVQRFVDGLLTTRAAPGLLSVNFIVGIPQSLEGESYPVMLAAPEVQERLDPSDNNRLVPSCVTPTGLAFPPPRMIRVAEGLQAAGAHTSVSSICQASFEVPLQEVLRGIGRIRTGS